MNMIAQTVHGVLNGIREVWDQTILTLALIAERLLIWLYRFLRCSPTISGSESMMKVLGESLALVSRETITASPKESKYLTAEHEARLRTLVEDVRRQMRKHERKQWQKRLEIF